MSPDLEPVPQGHIKIVDDAEENIDLLVELLAEEYELSVAMNGEDALEDLTKKLPDLILLDIMMPGIDGYEVCRRLQANELTRDIPVIFLSARQETSSKAKGFALGAVDYITKPFEVVEVKARVKTHMALKSARQKLARHNELLEKKVAQRTRQLVKTQEATILSMAALAEARDHDTGGHIMRTQRYVRLLAVALAEHPRFSHFLLPENIELLFKSAPLHDIGKIAIPDRILLKPGKYSPEEYEEMKSHCQHGYEAIKATERLLGSNSFLRIARDIAFCHHERWDGTGYPQGLQGNDIPIAARLMALADCYDAMVSKRVYKEAMDPELVAQEIEQEKGSHFDPDVVDAFHHCQDEFRQLVSRFRHEAENRVLDEVEL